MTQIDWTRISRHISEISQHAFKIEHTASVSGGSINQCWHLQGNKQAYFVKINHSSLIEMFIAEMSGLQAILATDTIKVPDPLCYGSTDKHAYLVLEYLDLSVNAQQVDNDQTALLLGEKLARMHQHGTKYYGWKQNNTIGSTPQINTQTDSWAGFWVHQRLEYQLKLAARNGFQGNLQRRGEMLLDRVPHFLAGHAPQPSLLHGDLWGGNAAVTVQAEPVIFDPAVYYGDRETDLAMTECFGGFSAAFYQGYNNIWPLPEGYQQRKVLYNLYHILNHLNLFGGSYLVQAEAMMEQLLVESG